MILLMQRVLKASVQVEEKRIASIGCGIAAFIGFERGDDEEKVQRMASRLLRYRLFPDEKGKLNRSLLDVGGHLLVVPNFTLAAETKKGLRADFSRAESPAIAAQLFDCLLTVLKAEYERIQSGMFGADMKVFLVNDGPVNFILRI